MPSNIIKSFADKTGKSESEVEKLWDKAKEIADESNHKEDYDYIVGILKKMLKLNEDKMRFRDLLENFNDDVSKEISLELKNRVNKNAVYFFDERLIADEAKNTFKMKTKRMGEILVGYEQARGSKIYKYNFTYL